MSYYINLFAATNQNATTTNPLTTVLAVTTRTTLTTPQAVNITRGVPSISELVILADGEVTFDCDDNSKSILTWKKNEEAVRGMSI